MDWRAFCDEHRIDYIEAGKSVKRGNINIACPWGCLEGKPRLGLDLESGYWACWFNPEHRGKSPIRLIMRLLRVGYDQARTEAGLTTPDPTLDELRARFRALDQPKQAAAPVVFPEFAWPERSFALRPRGRRSRPFIQYLADRDFDPECVDRYQLRASDQKRPWEWQGRILFPLHQHDLRVGLTGRKIARDRPRSPKYYSEPKEAIPCVGFNGLLATGGDALVVVEGPVDAMKLDWVAHCEGLPLNAVGLLGLQPTAQKLSWIESLARKYTRTFLVLDPGALRVAHYIQEQLFCPVTVRQSPPEVEDVGALQYAAAAAFARDLLAVSSC